MDQTEITVSFSEGFKPDKIDFSSWENEDLKDKVSVSLASYDEKDDMTFTASPGEKKEDLSEIGFLRSLKISIPEGKLSDIKNIKISGSIENAKVNTTYFLAIAKVSVKKGEDEKCSYTFAKSIVRYFTPSEAYFLSDVKELDYGSMAKLSVSGLGGNGNTKIKSYSLTITVPDDIYVGSVKLPVIKDADITLFVNKIAREVTEGVAAIDTTGARLMLKIVPKGSSFKETALMEIEVTNYCKNEKKVSFGGNVKTESDGLSDISFDTKSVTISMKAYVEQEEDPEPSEKEKTDDPAKTDPDKDDSGSGKTDPGNKPSKDKNRDTTSKDDKEEGSDFDGPVRSGGDGQEGIFIPDDKNSKNSKIIKPVVYGIDKNGNRILINGGSNGTIHGGRQMASIGTTGSTSSGIGGNSSSGTYVSNNDRLVSTIGAGPDVTKVENIDVNDTDSTDRVPDKIPEKIEDDEDTVGSTEEIAYKKTDSDKKRKADATYLIIGLFALGILAVFIIGKSYYKKEKKTVSETTEEE